MASNHESTLSDPLTVLSNPFTKAKSVKSTASSAPPAWRTRNIQNRRPIVQKSSQQPPQQLSDIPVLRADSQEDEEEEHHDNRDEEDEIEEAQDEIEEAQGENSDPYFLRTPGPSSGASQCTTTSSSKLRPKTSWIHTHIRPFKRGAVPFWACLYCSSTFRASGGTATFTRHLKIKHGMDPSATSVAQKRDGNGLAVHAAILRHAELNHEKKEEQREQLLAHNLNKTTLEYLYIRWTTTHSIAFGQVTHIEFRDWLEYVNPIANRLLPSSPDSIRSHAFALMQEGKQRLRHILATARSDIHITCDMWTSPNHIAVLAVVGHFTSEKLALTTATLAMIEIEGEHSGLNQAIAVLRVVDDFGIRGKLGYFVMDNATANDVLVDHIADSLHESNIAYDPKQRRLRCNGHVINLVVQAFLFGKDIADYEEFDADIAPSEDELAKWRRYGPLGKLHNIIVWIMASPQRRHRFGAMSNGLLPIRDNSTRWNSWYEMLDRAMKKLKIPLQRICAEESGLAQDILSPDDWQTLSNIRDFLQAFYDTTKATEGRKATLDRVLPSLDFMVSRIEEAADTYENDEFMRRSLHAAYTKILLYWNKQERSPVYIAAIVLDPTLKWSYFDEWEPEWRPNMKRQMREFWETYKPSTVTSMAREQANPTTSTTTNEFLLWMKRRKAIVNMADELDQYLSEPLLLRNDKTALDWWMASEQQSRFPYLSTMAIDIFSCPAMSSEPERVFSGAKHTLMDRWRMSIQVLELSECLKSWFRLGIYEAADLHTIIAIEQQMQAEN